MINDPLVIDVFLLDSASYVQVDVVEGGVSRKPTLLKARAADPPYAELKVRPLRAGLVKECGDKLCASLAANPGVLATLDRFQTPPRDTRHPIYVSIGDPEHENLPWEAIWRQSVEFYALGQHWPIARLPSASDDTKVAERVIGEVPRIMAVIAAEGADIDGEWTGFNKLLDQFPDRIDMHVLLASDQLKARIEKLKLPRVQCSWIGETADDVIQRIRTWSPNIVHFFCHGTSQNGGSLSVVNRLGETVKIPRDKLLQLRENDGLCLVVLNCCLGGNADPNDHASSIARELVKAGLPAVVAMREIITDKSANAFTSSFYAELFVRLRACLDAHPAGDNGPIEVPDDTWLDALFHARQALNPAGMLPADALEWTLPLIYVRRGGLQFTRRTESNARKAAEAGVLRDWQKILQAQGAFPDELRKLLEEKLKQ